MSNNTSTPAVTTDDIVTAYRAADTSGKAYMRNYADAALHAAIGAGDLVAAQAIIADTTAMRTPAAVVRTVDYAALIADRRAVLVAAVAAIDAGQVTLPDGVTLTDLPDDYAATVDMSEVTRLTTFSGRKSGRGDVAAYVAGSVEASGAASGTHLTVADIRRTFRNDDYADAAPSAGAVAAYLNRVDAGDATCDAGTVGTNSAGVLGVTVA